jgi:hypothetical protein
MKTLDAQVRARLKQWPQRPPGIAHGARDQGVWLRGRPDSEPGMQPFLKWPGYTRLRTLPDGLWMNFAGSPLEPFADVFAIEACSTVQNLLDKRSRFSASTQSLLVHCPIPWLLAPVTPDSDTLRWQAAGIFRREPNAAATVPVRNLRVMFALPKRHYQGLMQNSVPLAHEYFVPMDALTMEDGDKDPRLQAMVSRAAANANFMALS